MVLTTAGRRGGLFGTHFARLARAAAPGDAGGARPDMVVARALASVGLGGLVGLPFLLLASVALEVPLAAPAAIALGYLAGAREIAMRRPRRALAWIAAVLAGLVAWPLVSLLSGGGAPGGPALAALLLAPVFAAAPALARHIVAPKPAPGSAAALRSVECLDRLAPAEAVLFLARNGTICAGTRAGLAVLELRSRSAGADIAGCVVMADRPILLEALACSAEDAGPVELSVRRAGGAGRLIATISAGPEELLTLRLRPVEAEEGAFGRDSQSEARRTAAPSAVSAPIFRLDREIEQVLRGAEAKAWEKHISFRRNLEDGLSAIGEPRLLRRMLGVLIGGAVGRAPAGAAVEVLTRRLKGVALLRISVVGEAAGDVWEAEKMAIVDAIAEQLGGTALNERRPGREQVSVRLALAPARMAIGPGESRAGAE